ncbi:hypothetical protein NW767_015435, partial [Fusarium falciforme]
ATPGETTFPVVTPKDFLPSPLPGYLGKPLMLEAWKGSVVEVNKHNAAALVVPEPVSVALVAVVDALGPDVLRGTPHFRPQVCSDSARDHRVNRLPTPRHQHHMKDPRPARENMTPVEPHESQVHWYYLALELVEPRVDTALVLQEAKMTR